jgi:lambda family phage portal protein
MASRYYFNPKTGKMTMRESKRSYGAVVSDQFNEGWSATLTNAHSEFRGGSERLRNMTRDLERSNSYAIRFLNEWTTNIIGTGFTFQSLAENAAGREDAGARALIESAWLDWKKARNCTAAGDMPYCELKALTERACARDGGVLIQKLRGFDNDYNFALNVLEIDRLDHNYNVKINDRGNRIVMGKEIDQYGKPVAYHLLGEHPGETYSRSGKKRTRVPADQIIHRFYRKRPESAHGESLMVGAITGLRHLEKYEEAEQIAARVAASSVVAIERDASLPYEGDEYADQELAPGSTWQMEPGEKATLINPTHPNANYSGFRGGVLKGVASGLLMSYPTLAQDFGGVTYSSLRESKLNIKALTQCYRMLNVENEEEPIFRSWLSTAMASGAIRLPASNFRNFAKASFTGQGFPWVDPAKETAALEKELQLGATSLSRAVKERLGVSLDVIIAERKRDIEAFEAAGLPVPAALIPGADLSPPEDLTNSEEDE